MESTLDGTVVEAGITVRPLTSRIGAEVAGARLSESLGDATVAAIRRAALAHKVIFFRDQADLDEGAHVAFAGRFGQVPLGHPVLKSHERQPMIMRLDSDDFGRADHWHTDSTFSLRPPSFSILRAVQLPELGGDTMWADTQSAYTRLPPPLRALAEQLRVVHTNAYDYGRSLRAEERDDTRMNRDRLMAAVLEAEHPMVRVHEETGRRSLLLGGFAQHVSGLSSSVAADLLRIFQSYVLRPEHLVRWRWRPGDVAMWDNRSTQHYAVNDYGEARRRMERVIVAGEVPVGVDGSRSRSLRG
jgi:alpha-ketoglutarate-dependent taurine dioxygenase